MAPKLVPVLLALLVLSPLLVGAGAGPETDGSREATKSYVAAPQAGLQVEPNGSPLGVGRVTFDILPDETRALFTISDDVFDETEVTAFFRFDDAPIVHAVTFCRQIARDIPPGATHVQVVLEPLGPGDEDSTCGSNDGGATTGTVTVRFG